MKEKAIHPIELGIATLGGGGQLNHSIEPNGGVIGAFFFAHESGPH